MGRAEQAEREEKPGARRVGEDSVHQEVFYALVCKAKDDKVVERSKREEWRKREKAWEQLHRIVAHKGCQRACI